jgi:hypothetical protein
MTRSNRTLTQFAVDNFVDFTDSPKPEPFSRTKGNTTCSVAFDKEKQEMVFRVLLFDDVIFEASELGLTLRSGDFYDSMGRPSRTTRERLNGLLDASGTLKLIPEGVRVFFRNEGEHFSCRVGSGEICEMFDSKSPSRVLAVNPSQILIF